MVYGLGGSECAFCDGRLVTRPDVKSIKMEEFVSWVLDIMGAVNGMCWRV